MNKHTKEPWKVTEPKSGRVQISHSSGGIVGHAPQICAMWNSNKVTRANARRIVACVNACEGFSIEKLEGADLFKDSIESQIEIVALKQQRNELLKAVQYAEEVFDKYVVLHKAKGAAGEEKAQSNLRHQQVMLEAIANTESGS